MYKLYSRIDTRDTYLELWGASTKHPDLIYRFSDFKLSEWVPSYRQLFQWILECASKSNFPIHARWLVDYALVIYDAANRVPIE